MRVLLDEGIPRRLAALLRDAGVDAAPIPAEWRGASDRSLLTLAEPEGFTILVTQDRNMPFQSPLDGRTLAVLIVPQLDRHEVLSKLDAIRARLPHLEPGRYAVLGREGSLPRHPTKPLLR